MPDGIDSSPKGGAKSRSVFKLDETESKIAKGFPLGELASGARLRGRASYNRSNYEIFSQLPRLHRQQTRRGPAGGRPPLGVRKRHPEFPGGGA